MRHVLNNAFHRLPVPPPRVRAPLGGVDVFTSGLDFDGWRDRHLVKSCRRALFLACRHGRGSSHLGWRRLGPIGFHEIGPYAVLSG